MCASHTQLPGLRELLGTPAFSCTRLNPNACPERAGTHLSCLNTTHVAEHLSKIGVLLRQRRLLPEGKLKFFLDTRCPRLVVDGE